MTDTSGEQVRILIVEDDPITAAHLERILQHLGFGISACVSSGAEALASVEENRPHIVLMDINLDGDMTGIEVACMLHETRHLPVIYLTAYSDDEVLKAAALSAPYGYLVKPVQRETLQATIRMALSKSRVDAALRESEMRNRIIAEVISDFAYQFEFSNNGAIVTRWINDAFARAIHHADDVADAFDHWQAVVVSEDVPRFREHILKLHQGEASSCEYRLSPASGEVRWIRDFAHPVWTGTVPRVLTVYGAAQDVSLHKLAEQSLASSEYLFNTTVNAMSSWIHVVDRDLRLILVNRSMRKVCAKLNLPSTLVGEKLTTAFPFLTEKTIAEYHEVFRDGITLTCLDKQRIDAQEFETETVKSPVFENGVVVRVITTITDVTASMAAAHSLRDSEARLRAIIDSAKDSIFIKDTMRRYIVINPALARLYGREESVIIGASDTDLLESAAAAAIETIDERVLAGEQIEHELEIEIGGGLRYFHTIKAPLYGPDGAITGICGITRDVTDRVTTEHALEENREKLRELNASKDKLFSIVAHDMRGPFTTMLGFMEILQNDYATLTDDERKEYIDYVMSSFLSVYRLIENLLQWSRIQTGRIHVSPACLSLESEVRESVDFLHSMSSNKGVAVRMAAEPDLRVYADKELLQSILRNLLTNALKFTPRGGGISIESAREDGAIRVSITDTGVGMNAETLARLFRHSDQFSTLGTEQEKGTGLGLMLSKELAELQHGTIAASSEEGVGSVFTLRLPDAVAAS